MRDRMEAADRRFFEQVAKGYEAIAAAEPERFRTVNGTGSVGVVCANVWEIVHPILPRIGRG
jgi:thymidylate kinase